MVVIYGIQAKNGLLWGHRQGYGDTEITFGNMFEISIDDFWKLVSFEPIIEIDVFELPGFKAAYASQN